MAIYFVSLNELDAQAGSLDPGFQTEVGANSEVHSILVLPNDQMLIGGRFTSYNNIDRNRLARIDANGELDENFIIGTGFEGEDKWVEVITSSGQGGYYIGGVFSNYNGVDRNNVLRIDGNGDLDLDFNPGSGTVGIVLDIAVQSENKILIGGGFGKYNGQTMRGLCRALPDGSLDQTYISLLNSEAVVNSIYVDNSFQSWIVGSFGSFDGQQVNKLALLLPNGGLNENFEQDKTCNSFIDKIIPTSDGNFYIIGNFTEYDGKAVNKVAKIDGQGDLIEAFNVGAGPDYYPYDLAVQEDGKVIVVGDFTTFNNEPASRIVRLLSNGSIDPTFISGSGANGTILSCKFQSDGKIIIGGYFNRYDGNTANRLARLQNDLPTNTSSIQSNNVYKIYPNPASNSCFITGNHTNQPLDVKIFDYQGKLIKSFTTESNLDTSNLKDGVYLVQIMEGSHLTNLKIIVL